MSLTYRYVIYIKGYNLDDTTEEVLHLTYLFLGRALQEHRRQGRNGDYEAFAIQVLALLQKYRYVYTTGNIEVPEPE
jgi:hypothetical protein